MLLSQHDAHVWHTQVKLIFETASGLTIASSKTFTTNLFVGHFLADGLVDASQLCSADKAIAIQIERVERLQCIVRHILHLMQ